MPSLFDPQALAAHLPANALRYLTHAICPGAVLARQVEITYHGEIRDKPKARWRAFHARQIIEIGQAFRVISRTWYGPIPIATVDRYANGAATQRTLLFGRFAVAAKRGLDLSRAAHSRLVVDSAWLPTAYLPQNGARWTEPDGNLRLSLPIDGDNVQVTLALGPEGQPRVFTCQRWSSTEEGSYAWVPFTTYTEAETTFGGYTIPSTIRAAWWTGTEREFDCLRAVVDEASYLPAP